MNTVIKKNKINVSTKKTSKTKTKTKTKTTKSRVPSRNNAIKQTYDKEYYGKNLLPITKIVQYIGANFNDYMVMKEQKIAEDLPASSFEDFFIVDDILTRKENSADIDIQINKKSNVSLSKLLAYSLYYSEYKNWFKTKTMDIALFKNQVGKDVSRMDFMINNTKIKFNDEDDNSIKADKFNTELMNILSTFTVIDLNLINTIDVVMCQNILNFIMDLISLLVMKKFAPEKLLITQVEKNAEITLKKSQQNIVYNFKTKFYITKDGGVYDPEITCGDMEFSFLIDFKKNTYKITKFKCKYDADICYQNENVESSPENANANAQDEVSGEDKSKYLKYGVLGLGVGGIVGTPFLLGVLGGKNKKGKKSKRKSKTKKTKKSFYK
jgi:hypothetical protein